MLAPPSPPPVEPPDNAPWLRRRLQDPLTALSLAGLAEHWVQADILVRTTLRATAIDTHDPALPDRLRGMLGRALMEGASAEAIAGRPCPWQPPCALDLLFGDHGTLLSGRLPVPKPFVLSVVPALRDDDLLTLRLSLFGFASDWADTVAEAVVRGLRGGVAVSAGDRRPAETTARAIQFVGLPPLPCPLGDALDSDDLVLQLQIETPLSVRREHGGDLSARALLMGLCNRLSGLARWHDARLDEDWSALAALADRCAILLADLRTVRWARASGRQKQGGIPVSGVVGTLVLRGPLGPFLPALALGQAFGTGGHVALGLGRFRVTAIDSADAEPRPASGGHE